MAPTPSGTASCMNRPRARTARTASPRESAPAATSAEYSPREWPATKSGRLPCRASTAKVAAETVRIAGWVLAVSFSADSGPSKMSLASGSQRAASAASNTARASGKRLASSRPMPTDCEPWPGKR
jgi:hypothetical protein